MNQIAHKQIWVKVNAPVDEGIAELIEALSAFPKLQTIESCQGNPVGVASAEGGEGAPAVVFFHYGQHDHAHPYQDIADFILGYLGPELNKALGDIVRISLHVTDYGIRGDLIVRHGAMHQTVKTLRHLYREFNNQPP